jgi:hypothetical protein
MTLIYLYSDTTVNMYVFCMCVCICVCVVNVGVFWIKGLGSVSFRLRKIHAVNVLIMANFKQPIELH